MQGVVEYTCAFVCTLTLRAYFWSRYEDYVKQQRHRAWPLMQASQTFFSAHKHTHCAWVDHIVSCRALYRGLTATRAACHVP